MKLLHGIGGRPFLIQNRRTDGQRMTSCRWIRSSRSTRPSVFRHPFRFSATSQKPSSGQDKDSPLYGNFAQAREEQESESIPEAEVTAGQEEESLANEESTSTLFAMEMIPTEKVVIIARNGLLLFLLVTFLISVFNTIRKFLSPKAKRKRTVNKNRELIEDLIKYLPDKRSELTQKAAWMIRVRAGFSPTEVFRKYLWFLLRERKFDQTSVEDLICLKQALQLSEEDVATALKERAQRIHEKYGSLMLNTEGMTAAGIERKATCRALFSKILFLSEYEALLDPESEASKTIDLNEIFRATEEEKSKLRIVSLEEVDLDKLDQMLEESDE